MPFWYWPIPVLYCIFFPFVYGTLQLYCCCSERHRHTGYCYYASGVLNISSRLHHDSHRLEIFSGDVCWATVNGPRPGGHGGTAPVCRFSLFWGTKTPRRLVWNIQLLLMGLKVFPSGRITVEMNRTTAVSMLQPCYGDCQKHTLNASCTLVWLGCVTKSYQRLLRTNMNRIALVTLARLSMQ